MWVSTSSRMALMPMGSLTPSWPSTVKSRGRTWSTSRLEGMVTARATSVARSTSSRLTSRWGPLTATAPRELRLSIWLPPTPTKAASRRIPDSRSAASTEERMDATVCSMLLTTPLRRPLAGTMPLPMTLMAPSRVTSPTSTTTLLVPTSSATRTASISTAPLPIIRLLRHGVPRGPVRRSIPVRPIVADAERPCRDGSGSVRRVGAPRGAPARQPRHDPSVAAGRWVRRGRRVGDGVPGRNVPQRSAETASVAPTTLPSRSRSSAPRHWTWGGIRSAGSRVRRVMAEHGAPASGHSRTYPTRRPRRASARAPRCRAAPA